MKIGFICPTNPFTDKKEWSGTYYKMCEAIIALGHDVKWIHYSRNNLIFIITKRIHDLMWGRNTFEHTKLFGLLKIRTMDSKLDEYDIVFLPAQGDILSALPSNIKFIYFSDATAVIMNGYYWRGYSDTIIQKIIKLEREGVNKAYRVAFSSKWAADSAINDYNVDEKKVAIIPFGANIDESNIKANRPYIPSKRLNILFSGVSWQRKGGDIALEITLTLHQCHRP